MNKDMMIELGKTVKSFIAKSFEPLIKRLEILEAKEPIKGLDGKDGINGDNGQDGENGADGKSAFILACENGFTGNEREWLSSLKGLDGNDGQDGTNGNNGQDGSNGQSAYDIACAKGFDGSESDWLNSLKGLNGIDGQDGRNGEHGKDALEIDILPAIDPEKSYPRGTYAHVDGGVARAFKNTDTLNGELVRCGWDVVIDGIKSINITNNGRDFSIEIEKTSGQQAIQTFSLPVMLYQGVFKQDNDYQKGDVVTWAGSTWHCNEPTKSKPGESTDWTLMVKKGRDGKDGRHGEKGEKGIAGNDGRDHTAVQGIGNI